MTLFPDLDAAFREVVRPYTAGDPMREGVLWTHLSLRRLATKLATRGFRVSVKVVTQLLEKHHLGRRQALKNRALKHHPQQDRPFEMGAVRLITSILMLPELTSSGHQCESELFRVSGVAPDSPERPSR